MHVKPGTSYRHCLRPILLSLPVIATVKLAVFTPEKNYAVSFFHLRQRDTLGQPDYPSLYHLESSEWAEGSMEAHIVS